MFITELILYFISVFVAGISIFLFFKVILFHRNLVGLMGFVFAEWLVAAMARLLILFNHLFKFGVDKGMV